MNYLLLELTVRDRSVGPIFTSFFFFNVENRKTQMITSPSLFGLLPHSLFHINTRSTILPLSVVLCFHTFHQRPDYPLVINLKGTHSYGKSINNWSKPYN